MGVQENYLDEESHQVLRNAVLKAGRGPIRRLIRSAIPPVKLSCNGAHFMSYPKDNFTDFTLWLNGRPREHKSVSALAEIAKNKKLYFIDIGANMGLYTIMLANVAAPKSVIHAFEPNPVMASRCQENLKLNSLTRSVKLHRFALGAEESDSELHLTNNMGEASLVAPKAAKESISVSVKTLDEFLPKAKADCDVSILKIDIEGYEDKALKPLLDANVDKLPDWILIEVVHRDKWSEDIIEGLKVKGYNVVNEMEGNMLLSQVSVNEPDKN